jgi:DNA repair protein RecO (recombination protein O)
MEWRDTGIVLATRPFGETSVILDALTANHGRHSGVVKGGISRKFRPILQAGTVLDITWRARLDDHLGSFQIDLVKSRSAAMEDRIALAGLSAVSALLMRVLPERDPAPRLYDLTNLLLDNLGIPDALAVAYFHWEMFILSHLGYTLDLSQCAVTGQTQDLAYVSPKSGRAVSKNGAGEWANRLLILPDIAKGFGTTIPDALEGLKLTQFFLENRVALDLGFDTLPQARVRFIENLEKMVQRNTTS